MIKDKFGQQIYSKRDIVDLLMSRPDGKFLQNMFVDGTVNVESMASILDHPPSLKTYLNLTEQTVDEFDKRAQQQWRMPQEYKDLDIAKYILDLCKTDAELQRVGTELLLYQERDLFDLLRYLKYLVDTMIEHKLIWGVGRGSSVASYVLYLLKVHQVDSLYYDLDPREFLR